MNPINTNNMGFTLTVKDYQNMSTKDKNDFDTVKDLILLNGENIQYISDETLLSFNRESMIDIILTSMKFDQSNIWFVSDKVIGRIIHQIVEKYPDSIKWINVNNATTNGSEMVFYTLLKNGDGMALKYFHESLRDRHMIVKIAMHQSGYPFQFASDRLKNDKKFVLEQVVNRYGYMLNYVSDELKTDKEVVMAAVTSMRCNRWVFSYCSDVLKADKEFVKQIIAVSPGSVRYISDELRNNESYMKELIEINKQIKNYIDLSYIQIRKEIKEIRQNKKVENEQSEKVNERVDDLIISTEFDETTLIIKPCKDQLVIIPKLHSVVDLFIKEINHDITIELINRLPNLRAVYTNTESTTFRDGLFVQNFDEYVEDIKKTYEFKIQSLELKMEKEISELAIE